MRSVKSQEHQSKEVLEAQRKEIEELKQKIAVKETEEKNPEPEVSEEPKEEQAPIININEIVNQINYLTEVVLNANPIERLRLRIDVLHEKIDLITDNLAYIVRKVKEEDEPQA